MTSRTGEVTVNVLAYTGGVYDEENGQYYLNARYYDPEQGVFLTQDTYRGEQNQPATWNLYGYCGGNPVNYVDPSGHDAIWLQYKDGAGGFGHTGLLIQRANKKWYYYFWGAANNNWKVFIGCWVKPRRVLAPIRWIDTSLQLRPELLRNSVSRKLKQYLKNEDYYNETLTGVIYIKGNFENSYRSENQYIGNYNLYANNCVQRSVKLLSKGTFSNRKQKNMINIIKNTLNLVPNAAYSKMKRISSI